jgi:MFS family permease
MSITQPQQYSLQRRRYVVLGALWYANFVFWMSWFMQGPLLQSFWVAHRHVSFGSAEYLLSGVDIAGIFTALLFGYFFDRFGPKRATAMCLLVILIGFGLRPFATGSFTATLILTVIAGLGLPIIVSPPPVLSQWFGKHRIAIPVLIALSSFVCGQALGLLLGARMVGALGVRWAFGVMSIAIAAALIGWLLLVPRAPSAPAGPAPERPAPLRTALRTVLAAPGSWRAFAIGGVYAAIIVFAGSFLPGVLTHALSISPAGGGEGAAIVPAAAFFGIFLFAYLTRRGRSARFAIVTSVVQLIAWAAFAALWFTDGLVPAAAFVLLAAFGFCYQACFGFGLNKAEHGTGIGPETVGVAAGFYFTGVSIGGYVLPTVLAQIVDAVGAQGGFIGLGVFFLAGAVLWATARERGIRAPRGGDTRRVGTARTAGSITDQSA